MKLTQSISKLLITTIIFSIFLPFVNISNAVSLDPSQDEKLVAYNKASVVKILSTFCGSFSAEFFEEDYEFCAGATGSGFIINPDGYIATNGHVVSFSEEDKLITAFSSREVIEMFVDIISEVSFEQDGTFYSDSERKTIVEQILADESALVESINKMYEFYEEDLVTLENEEVKHYVQSVNNVFEFDDNRKFINPTEHFEAELLASDYERPELNEQGELEFETSDVAILKIDTAYDLPTVRLGNISTISQGSPLVVMGFPGKADSIITNISSNTEVTITKGVVSAIKDEAGGQRKLVQTDASLGHGNSGGPGFDSNGDVVGIATYVSIVQNTGDEAADFNFLRDIADLRDLAEDNNVNIAQGELDANWEEGLELFWNYKLTDAIEKFELVKAEYPNHPLVDDYISRAQTGIENGEEVLTIEEQIYRFIPEEQFPFAVAGIVGFCLLGIFFLIVISLFRKKSKGKKQDEIPPMPQSSNNPQPNIQPLGYGNNSQSNNSNTQTNQSPVQPLQPVQPIQQTDMSKVTSSASVLDNNQSNNPLPKNTDPLPTQNSNYQVVDEQMSKPVSPDGKDYSDNNKSNAQNNLEIPSFIQKRSSNQDDSKPLQPSTNSSQPKLNNNHNPDTSNQNKPKINKNMTTVDKDYSSNSNSKTKVDNNMQSSATQQDNQSNTPIDGINKNQNSTASSNNMGSRDKTNQPKNASQPTKPDTQKTQQNNQVKTKNNSSQNKPDSKEQNNNQSTSTQTNQTKQVQDQNSQSKANNNQQQSSSNSSQSNQSTPNKQNSGQQKSQDSLEKSSKKDQSSQNQNQGQSKKSKPSQQPKQSSPQKEERNQGKIQNENKKSSPNNQTQGDSKENNKSRSDKDNAQQSTQKQSSNQNQNSQQADKNTQPQENQGKQNNQDTQNDQGNNSKNSNQNQTDQTQVPNEEDDLPEWLQPV